MTKAEQIRLSTCRLKVLEQAGEDAWTVARTCRHFGISRKTLQMETAARGAWYCGSLRSLPATAPLASGHRPEVVTKISYLRQTYHFGAGKIADYLKRFHGPVARVSSIHRLLPKHGLSRLPANQKHRARPKRWKRDTKARSGLMALYW